MDDIYKYNHHCDMEIETDFQGIPLGKICHFKLIKLPISHNTVVGENAILQLSMVFSHSEFISNSTLSR